MLTEEQAKDLIKEALPEIQEGLKRRVKIAATHQLETQLSKLVREEVAVFLAEKAAPKIQEALLEAEQGIVAAACAAAGEIGTAVQVALVEDVTERLNKDWERREILRVIFGSRP